MKRSNIIFGFFAVVALIFLAYAALTTISTDECEENETGLACIELPPGFSIDYYAEDVEWARSMTLGPNGTLFVGSRNAGKVYALPDRDRDSKADDVFVIDEGLDLPSGVAFRNGSLYVAEVSRVLRYDNIEANIENPPEPVLVNDDFPVLSDRSHAWKYIKFGPDGKLYVPIGMPCNVCNKEGEDEHYGTIMRMEPDGSQFEIFSKGIRNTVGFDWDPETGELWFTDNGKGLARGRYPSGRT